MGKEEQKQVGGELLMDEENKSDKEALSKIDFFFPLSSVTLFLDQYF